MLLGREEMVTRARVCRVEPPFWKRKTPENQEFFYLWAWQDVCPVWDNAAATKRNQALIQLGYDFTFKTFFSSISHPFQIEDWKRDLINKRSNSSTLFF
jgi:hypothetical protein